jgi:hypothetical protein
MDRILGVGIKASDGGKTELKGIDYKNSVKSASKIEKVDAVDLRPLKEQLRIRLPPDSRVLTDLLNESDSMSIDRAEVLIPHYLQRLERELDEGQSRKPRLLLR